MIINALDILILLVLVILWLFYVKGD